MTVATEIKAYLDSLGSLGTIKIGHLPPTPNVVGVIYEYGGMAPERRFGVVGVGYAKPSIQVAFRGEPYDYNGPYAKVVIVQQALMSIQPGALGGGVSTVYLTIDPQQEPHPVAPMDDNNRHLIGVNFFIVKEPS